ncbi:MAG: sensor histidine kinase [Acidimicrobiia bacterium]
MSTGWAGMRRRFDQADIRVTGEIVVAVVRVAMGVSMVLVLITGPDLDYHPGAARIVLGVAVAYSWAAMARVLREAERGEVSRPTSYALTALDAGFIVALSGLTGGTESPMLPILVVVVISQSVRFGLSRALLVSTLTAAVLAPVLIWVDEPAGSAFTDRLRLALWWAWMLVSGAVFASFLSGAAEQALKRRAAAEAAAREERRRREQQRHFLQAISHDFRTPIASLEALTEALGWQQSPLTEDQRAEAIELLRTHAGHLTSLLGEVRDAATDGPGPVRRFDTVEVADLVHTAATAAGLAPERMSTSIDPRLGRVRTDVRKVSRILANLVENAARHSPPGQLVDIRVSRSGKGAVVFAVGDRGCGIPPELAASVFEKGVSFGEHRSSGLGMWIVDQFVASLGGTITLENRRGGGLVVRVVLPMENLPDVASDAPSTAEGARH